jgi:DNA-binding SARP family transcriptional activator
LLTYVALAPGATATRVELLAAFWPNAPRAVASQGLRTTLCRLRHAVSNAAGRDAGHYIRIEESSIALSPDWVSIDTRLFRGYVERAEAEYAEGNRGMARDHFLQADRLYTGGLLASEALEPALALRYAEYSDLMELVLAQLVEMYAQEGNANLRKVFASRRAALSSERERHVTTSRRA